MKTDPGFFRITDSEAKSPDTKFSVVEVTDPKKTIRDMPGVFYSLLGEFLGEKLPLIIFTNRDSFKVSLDYQLEMYTLYINQASFQMEQFEEIMAEIPESRAEIVKEITEIREVIEVYTAIKDNVASFRQLVQ